jgi:hypothetical protein
MSAADHSMPTISRVLDDGTLIELLYDPTAGATALAVRHPGGMVSRESVVDLPTGERLVPYSARNNLIVNECVLLPADFGDFGDVGDLVEEIQAFLHRYVDLSPLFEAVAAHYVLLTWVYDAFNDLPYLRLRGDYGTGKTRALLALGSLCYKAFFASGASTVSPIFHIQDAFQGTLVLDEADFRFSDATAELTKVLNNGTTRGLPVLRTMTNRNRELNPQAFRVFGPKIIAMREDFSDRALESRFLTEEMGGRAVRQDVPIHLPRSFKEEAQALRNKLLAWRFHARFLVSADLSRLPERASPRTKQISLALLSVIEDEALRARLVEHLENRDARVIEERADTLDAAMLSAIIQTFGKADAPHAAVRDIAERFNAREGNEFGSPVTNKWVGSFIRRRFRLSTTKTGGVYVVPFTERDRVVALAERFGLTRPSDSQNLQISQEMEPIS